jgi:acyl transferase domain-containing protein
VRALRQAFGPLGDGRCAIGSVKSNIGHPESAAGVAGLIKAVLSLEHKVLFPSLHYSRPNPEIEFPDGFYVNTVAQPWTERPYPRRAGVNSLGIGGTNAFVILEEAPAQRPVGHETDRPCHVLTLSAKTATALDAAIDRFATYLRRDAAESLANVCYSANVGRAHFQHRLALVASDAEEARSQLEAARTEGEGRTAIDLGRSPRVAFLFTGQGSQYAGMARELYTSNATFRAAFDRCAEMVAPYLGRSLATVVFPSSYDAGLINETGYTQPALFAVEYALAMLWQSWGVSPSLVAGHSVGELVAACVAGVFSVDDALLLVAERGRLMQALPAGGGMDAMLADFSRVAESLTYSPPAIPIVSNVTGDLAGPEIATPGYWLRHIRESVRFADGIVAAHRHGIDIVLEVGPSPVLIGLARQCIPSASWTSACSLRNGRSDWRQLADSLATLYTAGVAVDWAAFDREYRRRRVHLPTYPFERTRYWMDPPATPVGPTIPFDSSLLGQRLRLPRSAEVRFEARWSRHAPAYLDDHRVFEKVVVPGASHLAMALSAWQEMSPQGSCVLEDVVFPQALTLGDEESCTAQLILENGAGPQTSFQLVSLREGEDENESTAWVVHATGRLRRDDGAVAASVDLAATRARCLRYCSGEEFYARFWDSGYHLRGAFRWIDRIWAGTGELVCELQWPELPDDPAQYPLYPSLIDGCFQCVFSDTASALLKPDAVYVPFSVMRFVFHDTPRPGARLWCHVTLSPLDEARHRVDADIALCDDAGHVVAAIVGCQLREISRDALIQEAGKDLRDTLYAVRWQPELRTSSAQPVRQPGSWNRLPLESR